MIPGQDLSLRSPQQLMPTLPSGQTSALPPANPELSAYLGTVSDILGADHAAPLQPYLQGSQIPGSNFSLNPALPENFSLYAEGRAVHPDLNRILDTAFYEQVSRLVMDQSDYSYNPINIVPLESFAPLGPMTQPVQVPARIPFALPSPQSVIGPQLWAPPQAVVPLRPLPEIGPQNMSSPENQLKQLGQKYGVVYEGGDLAAYQKRVIKAALQAKAQEYGIPVNIVMGIAGNESAYTMWKDISTGEVIQGKNIRDGVLKSTDWGVMQINDKAHPKAFPRAKMDIEYNIDYGLQFLARRRSHSQGDLGLGFGSWDSTIASYNLGHSPKSERDLEIATRYVSHVKKRAQTA